MPTFTTRRRVAFTPEQMFQLVADVEQYPKFLPLCEALVVKERTRDGEGRAVMVAQMDVGYRAIRERFITRVTLEPAALRILATYIDGPFSRLNNRWNFVAAPGGSEVEFFIDYEFKSFVLQMLMGSMFDTAFRKFTDAFEARARVVYGVRGVAAV